MSDFPVTRQLIDRLDSWMVRFTRALPDPVRIPEGRGRFHWEYEEKSGRVVQMAKAVRMTSGIRAALLLADGTLVTESASLLRMVSDFSLEIIALGEGMMRGNMTSAQRKFIEQYFAPFPKTPEEFEQQERDFYVSREDLMKSEVRLANAAAQDGEHLRSLRRYLNKGYDAYVHGGYLTAMQLYHGGIKAFKTRGTDDDVEGLRVAKAAVAGKLHEVLVALEFMANLWGLSDLHAELREARRGLDTSREQSLG